MRFYIIALTLISIQMPIASAEECAIDVVMASKLKEVNAKSKAAVALYQQPDIEEESCLPTLSGLSGQLGASIPTFSGLSRGLATKIRNMACSAADDAIKKNAKALNASWNAPFGLGGVGIGVGTNGNSGVTITDAKASELENEILRKVKEADRAARAQDPYYEHYEPEVFPGINDMHEIKNDDEQQESWKNVLGNF